jgi:hypothetical protein
MKPMKVPFLFAVLFALALSGQAAERPNIVLIMADDLAPPPTPAREAPGNQSWKRKILAINQ